MNTEQQINQNNGENFKKQKINTAHKVAGQKENKANQKTTKNKV